MWHFNAYIIILRIPLLLLNLVVMRQVLLVLNGL
uniref:Uncharacterized protein n=1 Tax=Anguilla anguilla TaxID=7936 RepID=A0A0E9QQJ7_ANGAN